MNVLAKDWDFLSDRSSGLASELLVLPMQITNERKLHVITDSLCLYVASSITFPAIIEP